MMTSEENVKQKANENRKAEERILGLMKAWTQSPMAKMGFLSAIADILTPLGR